MTDRRIGGKNRHAGRIVNANRRETRINDLLANSKAVLAPLSRNNLRVVRRRRSNWNFNESKLSPTFLVTIDISP